uniref:Methyltransferase n=1 Tax=Nelumbo nucifera TaxID=4432 RepID=A0A822YR47_NELNU|nr:TPA_asm: hypothetical protein HUJ06_012366 [Nelumbo nucifera]
MEDILLEMDRILRPEGTVIFRDDVDVLLEIKSITDGMNWESKIVDHEKGPLEREKLQFAMKTYWAASFNMICSSFFFLVYLLGLNEYTPIRGDDPPRQSMGSASLELAFTPNNF